MFVCGLQPPDDEVETGMTFSLFLTLWLAILFRIEVSYKLAGHELNCIHRVNMDLIDHGHIYDQLSYPDKLGTSFFDLTLWTEAQIRERRIIPAIIKELP